MWVLFMFYGLLKSPNMAEDGLAMLNNLTLGVNECVNVRYHAIDWNTIQAASFPGFPG